jgi:very-short-patch-repair endonuclease
MRSADTGKTRAARRLRRDGTVAEQRLWNRLRARSISGMKFVRQEPIGPYIVDFACRELRLIVEVDRGQHADSRSDAIRNRWFLDQGYRVLRFWNNDVLSNIEGVLLAIADMQAQATASKANDAASPSPRLRGEGRGEGQTSGEGHVWGEGR